MTSPPGVRPFHQMKFDSHPSLGRFRPIFIQSAASLDGRLPQSIVSGDHNVGEGLFFPDIWARIRPCVSADQREDAKKIMAVLIRRAENVG